jgi:uncharacterized protein (TIGR00730 family)
MAKIVAVFGTAQAKPNSDLYKVTENIGQVLAKAGYTVMSGGYEGVMEAVSKGALEAGGSVHGITVEIFERVGESRMNKWVSLEYRYPTLAERIDHLITRADAYIMMPGGIGTMQEFAETWQRMRLGDIPQRPIFIFGDFWKAIIDQMHDAGYIHKMDAEMLLIVKTPREITDALKAWYKD